MQPSAIYTFTLTASGVYRLMVSGRYFKILASTGIVDVRGDGIDLKGLGASQGLEKTPFDYLNFTDASGAGNTIRVVVSDEAFIDGFTGTMSVTANKAPQSSSFANTAATVTTASAQLIAANTGRQYLLIQNKSTTGNIWVNFGAAATQANGVKILAGGQYELENCVSTQIINAIGDIASNPDVVVVQG